MSNTPPVANIETPPAPPPGKWLPSAYQDESIPPLRYSPNDWIVTGPLGTQHLASNEHCWDETADEAGLLLTEGMRVRFDCCVDHGEVTLTLYADGTWSTDRQPPPGVNCFGVSDEWEGTVTNTLADLADTLHEDGWPTDLAVACFAWSTHTFVFQAATCSFVPAPDEHEGERALTAAAAAREAGGTAFQARVKPWLEACFGQQIAIDKVERNHRFVEEALELVQAAGATASECHQLVDYVFGRPTGDIRQEVGGVMNTLAALCLAHGLDMHEAAEVELARVWTMVEKIRAKQAAKPKHSPLPEAAVREAGAAERWQHVKTGGFYQVITRGERESDLVPVVVYRSEADGRVWVRVASEFDDGRFVPALPLGPEGM